VIRSLIQRLFVGPWSSTILTEGGGSIPYVSAGNALRYTPVYRAVTLIANDIARIEMEVTASGADSLLRSPSPYMSAFEMRRAMTMQVLLYGNAFAAINRTRGGELLELILLEPDSVSLDLTGPRPLYRTRLYGDLAQEQIFHLRAPNTTGLWGDSPINLCRTSLQLMAAQEEMALKAYSNAGNPKIALVHPGPLSLEARQRITADYEAKHAGTQNTGKPLVLAEGMRVERISSTLDDAGLQAARQYSVGDVSRIYGVPSSYLSENVGPSYGTLEWLSRMYVDACLQQWMQVWKAEIITKLATPFDSVIFDTDDIVRPGMAETMAALRTAVEAGFMTRNEAREELDLEPLPGLDAPIVALNMGTGGGQTNLGDDTSEEAGTPNDF
jgi:HK97 family phage portal protein